LAIALVDGSLADEPVLGAGVDCSLANGLARGASKDALRA
jgi:hypothetical protein